MTTHTTEIHIKEVDASQAYERTFECWLQGATNLFPPEMVGPQVLPSSQAIRWAVSVDKEAYQIGQRSHFDAAGNPVEVRVETVRIHENF